MTSANPDNLLTQGGQRWDVTQRWGVHTFWMLCLYGKCNSNTVTIVISK